MAGASPHSRSHQVTLQALEVLRLIGDRMEQKNAVDMDDVRFLIQYLHHVADPCLMGSAPAHMRARTLFTELDRQLDAPSDEFVRLSRVYTNLLADLILLDGLDVQDDSSVIDGNCVKVHRLELKYISPHCI
jgi:hypothetical protein